MSEQPDGPDREIHDVDEVAVDGQMSGRDVSAADEIGTEEGT